MDVVDRNQMGKVIPETAEQGPVLVGKQLGRAAGGDLLSLHHGVQAHDGVALALVLAGKARDVLSHSFRVLVRSTPDRADGSAFLLRKFAGTHQGIQPFAVRSVVEVSELVPLAIAVDHLRVGGHLRKCGVLGEHEVAVQEGIDQDHHDPDHDDHGDQTVQDASDQISCHFKSLALSKNGAMGGWTYICVRTSSHGFHFGTKCGRSLRTCRSS